VGFTGRVALRGAGGWTRRRAVLAVLVGLVAAGAGAAPLARALDPVTEGVDQRVVLPSGRAYVLHVPPALLEQPRGGEGRPAMVVVHGLDSDPADAARSTGFDRLSDRDGVLVAYPEGVRDSFNAGLCCGPAVTHGVDDVAFLADVIRDLRRRGAGRVSVAGFSNGGMMAYRLGCERPELVATVGVVAGTLEIPRCRGPITALHFHGDDDTSVPYRGTLYSRKLKTFLRDVRTIQGAARGSRITIRVLDPYPHRWTEPGDPVDATAELWRFAGMDR
jgi:poly(3-hydroxybutyrate) depolymerase